MWNTLTKHPTFVFNKPTGGGGARFTPWIVYTGRIFPWVILVLSILPTCHIDPMHPKEYGCTLSLVPDSTQEAYSTECVLTGGAQRGPTELEADGYQQGGVPYRAPLSLGFGGYSYAASWLSISRIPRQMDEDRVG